MAVSEGRGARRALALGLAAWALAFAGPAAARGLTPESLGLDPRWSKAASIHIDASPELAWQVLEDVERWPEFLPGMRSASIRQGSGGRALLRQEYETLGFKLRMTTRLAADPESGTLRLTLDPELDQDLRALTTVWRLSPEAGGTRAELVSQVRVGRFVPGFIERRVVADSVGRSLAAFAAEVKRRLRGASGL